MLADLIATDNAEARQRDRCYVCYRPKTLCFCESIPAIDNRTKLLILQHARERSHAFNTARIVKQSLRDSQLVVGHSKRLALASLPIEARAGLLYPGPEATLISELPPEQFPSQLVILDGTWHHARTMLRDISALHTLPRYRLAPKTPGRYRIRREPDAMSLSTLEATVAAMRALEPETAGWDALLTAFETMVDRQLAHPKMKDGWRRNERRRSAGANIPSALIGDLGRVVVAYGESTPWQRGEELQNQTPLYWVATRIGTGEQFSAMLQPEFPLPDSLLEHLELNRQHFATASSLEQFRTAWADFLRPEDILVVYHQSTATLLSNVRAKLPKSLVLKSVCLDSKRTRGTLDQRLEAEKLIAGPAAHPGRAGKRLAKATALVRHLNVLGGSF